jgi:UTP--glucose-1-phosphate uridylyltransferase
MDEVSAYGVITPSASSPADGPFEIEGIVEKPRREDAPSDLIILGRYVLTPDIFGHIAELRPHPNGELQLTDALLAQSRVKPILGHLTTTERWDTGTPFGWLTAVVDNALRRPDTGPQLREWLRGRL